MAIRLYQEYRLKFYLNARHYIIIHEQKGDVHPHTWEFALYVRFGRNNFVEFHKMEQGINDYLAPLQNTILNEAPPFDAITPTLEYMVDYFAMEFYRIIEEVGGILIRVEGSETPTRSYIVNLEAQEEETKQMATKEEQVLSDLMDAVLDEIVK